jgi:two-component system, OmpR family, sensor histidine kinase KdpD
LQKIASLLNVSTVLLLKKNGRPDAVGSAPENILLGPIDIMAADWAFERDMPAGRDTTTLTASDWQFRPLTTSLGVLALLCIGHAGSGDPLLADKRILFTTLLGQAALAQERLKLEGDARDVAILKQHDELRATLIASLSHDLKTPLRSLISKHGIRWAEIRPWLRRTVSRQLRHLTPSATFLWRSSRATQAALCDGRFPRLNRQRR